VNATPGGRTLSRWTARAETVQIPFVGKEIDNARFGPADFERFSSRLETETALLEQWLGERRFRDAGYTAGFELEACLLDRNFFPVAGNDDFLARLDHPLVVPELSQFNIEINGTPQPLSGRGLRTLEEELAVTWRRCEEVANDLDSRLMMIGIVPTLRQQDLTLANISKRNRYYALNEQVLRLRKGRPLHLRIAGRDRIDLEQANVMLEAAATSFQVHLQVPADEIVRYYNASLILSAPMVALAANSPYLFGKSLWDETRIPVFDTGDAQHPERCRVTFGSGYLTGGPLEYFRENLERYPALLPMELDQGEQRLRHLRLHNGTIWRWNRLLLGFDESGIPHLRIEHRVLPAGPTIADMLAGAAVYFGAARFLAGLRVPPESDLPFETARDNLYRAARDGLGAELDWLGGTRVRARELLAEELIHMAREGLILLGVDRDDAHRYLDLVRARVRSEQNGALWQRARVDKHGGDVFRMTADYLEQQRSAMPVHEWPV
jgi:gamma-glutamyl:cysteine ligase YbdK (ATP-grasp superfamily)